MKWSLVAGLLSVASVGAAAAEPKQSTLVTAMVSCKAVADGPQRLACYDATVGKLAEATAKGDIKVVDREDVRKTRRSLFGFNMPARPFFSGDDSVNDTPAEIDMPVRSVHADGLSKFTLTMEDGSVWSTTEPLPRDPRPGATAHLKRGLLGNYFLSVNGGRMARAIRLK